MRGAIKQTMSRDEQADQYLAHRVRYLPTALDSARRKVAALEREAARYGMDDLLQNPRAIDRAWNREIELAKATAVVRDLGLQAQ